MGDCAYCGKRRINFNQDNDYTMRIENNDRGDCFIATGELMIDSIAVTIDAPEEMFRQYAWIGSED